MKLLIHCGLHKTGSTFFQHVCNDNADALATHGVYYQKQGGYPAHHEAAWRLLIGDEAPLLAMVKEAQAANCHTLILSSEDLEGALYDERPIAAIQRAAAQAGIADIEWHIALRHPGDMFASLFAQLHHHIYADALAMFYDVMRRGFVHFAAPMPDAGTPYWYYSFDHDRDLARLSERVSGTVIAHDFAGPSRFPGSQILASCDALGAITKLPDDNARNARSGRDAVIAGFLTRLAEALPDEADQQIVFEGFLNNLGNSLANADTYGALIGKRYADSHAAALAQFSLRKSSLPTR